MDKKTILDKAQQIISNLTADYLNSTGNGLNNLSEYIDFLTEFINTLGKNKIIEFTNDYQEPSELLLLMDKAKKLAENEKLNDVLAEILTKSTWSDNKKFVKTAWVLMRLVLVSLLEHKMIKVDKSILKNCT